MYVYYTDLILGLLILILVKLSVWFLTFFNIVKEQPSRLFSLPYLSPVTETRKYLKMRDVSSFFYTFLENEKPNAAAEKNKISVIFPLSKLSILMLFLYQKPPSPFLLALSFCHALSSATEAREREREKRTIDRSRLCLIHLSLVWVELKDRSFGANYVYTACHLFIRIG